MEKAFTNEAEFEEKYERFLGDLPQAGEEIRDGHARMESSFRDYLDAFEKWVFRHAYECGYAAAMEESLVKGYRVKFWQNDGTEEHLEFDSMERAQTFYDSLDGLAEIQQYSEERHGYEAIIYPEFEY